MEVPYYIVAERPEKLSMPDLSTDRIAKLTFAELYVLQYLYTIHPNRTELSDYMDMPKFGYMIANDIDMSAQKARSQYFIPSGIVYSAIVSLHAKGFIDYEAEYIDIDIEEGTQLVLVRYRVKEENE